MLQSTHGLTTLYAEACNRVLSQQDGLFAAVWRDAMQGSNFSREVEDPGQHPPSPRSPFIGPTPQPEEPLADVLRHLQASLDHVRTVQERVARQRDELKTVRAEVVAISEMERGRIGRDLHDVLGQILAAIAFLSTTLEQRLQAQGMVEAADARQISDLASEGMHQTRALARGLCAMSLRAEELVPQLAILVTDTQRTFHMACHFEPPQGADLVRDDTVATNLYCIARESITNAVKHGRAHHTYLRLSAKDDTLVLAIQDDGVGFDRAARRDGIGLRIMGHRAGLMGGSLLIESKPGAGTTVTCTIPAHRP